MDASAVRLTQTAHGGGCACKIPPGELEEVVRDLIGDSPPAAAGDLLVGLDAGDDAAVVRIADGWAVVATADFFTPIVDDPYDWGRIAAANALSDIYAMGGTPAVAVNLLGWPRDTLPLDLARDVLRGGLEVARSARCHVAGGHSIDDPEPKYGMAVTGIADPERLLRNDAGRAGLPLTLTKPLGLGVLNNRHKATGETFRHAVETMAALNRDAARDALACGLTCATDVTGFGLLGHLYIQARPGERGRGRRGRRLGAVPRRCSPDRPCRLRAGRYPTEPRLGPAAPVRIRTRRGRTPARRRPDLRRPSRRRRITWLPGYQRTRTGRLDRRRHGHRRALAPPTSFATSSAMARSSSVGTTQTATRLPSGDTTRAGLPASLRSGSTVMPSGSSPASDRSRTSALCSPTPAVNVIASSRPSTAWYAPTYLRMRWQYTSRASRAAGSPDASRSATRRRSLSPHRPARPDRCWYRSSTPGGRRDTAEATRVLGGWLRDVVTANQRYRNFRMVGPDETESNRLGAVLSATDKAWHAAVSDVDVHVGPHGSWRSCPGTPAGAGWRAKLRSRP